MMLYRPQLLDVFLKFRYEERDMANALRLRMAAALRGRVELTLAAIVCVIGCIVSYGLLSRGAIRSFVAIIVVPAGLVVAVVVAGLLVLPKIILRRRAWLHAPMTVDASDEGITVTAKDRYETIRWTDCLRVEADKRVCALYHGADVLLVPRRVFRSARQEKAFLDLLDRFVRHDEQSSGASGTAG